MPRPPRIPVCEVQGQTRRNREESEKAKLMLLALRLLVKSKVYNPSSETTLTNDPAPGGNSDEIQPAHKVEIQGTFQTPFS